MRNQDFRKNYDDLAQEIAQLLADAAVPYELVDAVLRFAKEKLKVSV